MLLTLAGWTGPWIAEAVGVREDTVRLSRSDFAKGGVYALKASVASRLLPVKSAMALCSNTIARGARGRPAELDDCPSASGNPGVRGYSHRPVAVFQGVAKKVPLAAAPAHLEETADGQRGGSDRLSFAPA
jgi:hypothetical protein